MKKTKIIMGMPITIDIVDKSSSDDLAAIFSYFEWVDEKFSTFKKNSEITKINEKQLAKGEISKEMKEVFLLAEKTKRESFGFFDIYCKGKIDPSGIVKGWAILRATEILKSLGFSNFYVDAGGDVQVSGKNRMGKNWKVGIKNPFSQNEIVKIVNADDVGVATSGTYIKGKHIYNPMGKPDENIVSLTVIGPNILDADRFATAAFAMGNKGIDFIENFEGLEGYMIYKNGTAKYTSGFEKYSKIS